MEQLMYIIRFFYRIKWWLIIGPFAIAIIAIIVTQNMKRTYTAQTTIYTGIVSGFGIESEELGSQNWNILNNTLENIINIITSKETLKDVSLRLYAQDMIYGDAEKDNTYIKAKNYRELLAITPKDVLALIDKTSEEETVKNLKAYETNSSSNFIYGLFNWVHPHYSYEALRKINVKKLGNSDMLEITYSSDDPGIAYNTLAILNQAYVHQYKDIQFGTTNNVIKYFEQELEKVGHDLRGSEDSLTIYNVENRVINYEEQTKQVAALDKDFELKYQDVQLNYNSAKALITHIEGQLSENVKFLKGNAQFINKLNAISSLNSKILELEAFNGDSLQYSNSAKITAYKGQLRKAEADFRSFSQDMSSQKYTREGYPTSNFVSQWLEELLKLEKAKAELRVMQSQKVELDKQYSHFSPIGSTLKRKERNIDFMERSYLSILSSLNTARLRLKSLEMNSASLKVLNPPTFPLVSEPTRRRVMIITSFVASFFFILGFFLTRELLGRKLRDKLRTERITSGKVIGAVPKSENLGRRRLEKYDKNLAIRHLCNVVQNKFGDNSPRVLNIISIDPGAGKSFVSEAMCKHWTSNGFAVKTINWETDISPDSKEYLTAQSVSSLYPSADMYDIVIVEYPPLEQHNIPAHLLTHAILNMVVLDANSVWDERSQILFNNITDMSDNTPVGICLNNVNTYVIESFVNINQPNNAIVASR